MRSALVLAAVLVLAACGIPVDETPVSFDLEAVGPAVEDPPVGGELAAAPLYLVGGDGLVRVTRDLPDPVDAGLALASLLSGVTEPEDRSGLSTSIPIGTRLLGLDISDGVAVVDLSADFATVGGQQEILAVAQIVLTLSQSGDANGVVFELEGVRTDVPTADGALATEPVRASDYESLVER